MNGLPPAGWHPDPAGRHQLRYWDGVQWTEHASTRGERVTDPLAPGGPPGTGLPAAAAGAAAAGSRRVQRQAKAAGVVAGSHAGGGTILTEPVLVVNQKPKLFEVKAEYAVLDQHGRRLGVVREVRRGLARKVIGQRSDRSRTYRLQVVDASGQVCLHVTRPAKHFRSKLLVSGAGGRMTGQIVQENLGILGAVRFRLESGGRVVGSMHADDRSAWDFSIRDDTGDEVARVTKSWAGLAKELFTKADNYVVEMHRPLQEPLRSLVVAAALAIDTALKQDSDWSHRRSR